MSPSERALDEGTLELFPDGAPDERGAIVAAAAHPELRVQALLRDVRDEAQTLEARRAWFARARELAEPMSRHAWFSLHLALVRHAMLVGDEAFARARAGELIALLAAPGAEVTSQDSTWRDALRRARWALRVAILAHTIGLTVDDPWPRIWETARSDRSIDDVSRVDVLVEMFAGMVAVGVDAAAIADLLDPALGSSELRRTHLRTLAIPSYLFAIATEQPALAQSVLARSPETVDKYRDPKLVKRALGKAQREYGAWCGGETSPRYLARPIYEWDRVPREIAWKRINEAGAKALEASCKR